MFLIWIEIDIEPLFGIWIWDQIEKEWFDSGLDTK